MIRSNCHILHIKICLCLKHNGSTVCVHKIACGITADLVCDCICDNTCFIEIRGSNNVKICWFLGFKSDFIRIHTGRCRIISTDVSLISFNLSNGYGKCLITACKSQSNGIKSAACLELNAVNCINAGLLQEFDLKTWCSICYGSCKHWTCNSIYNISLNLLKLLNKCINLLLLCCYKVVSKILCLLQCSFNLSLGIICKLIVFIELFKSRNCILKLWVICSFSSFGLCCITIGTGIGVFACSPCAVCESRTYYIGAGEVVCIGFCCTANWTCSCMSTVCVICICICVCFSYGISFGCTANWALADMCAVAEISHLIAVAFHRNAFCICITAYFTCVCLLTLFCAWGLVCYLTVIPCMVSINCESNFAYVAGLICCNNSVIACIAYCNVASFFFTVECYCYVKVICYGNGNISTVNICICISVYRRNNCDNGLGYIKHKAVCACIWYVTGVICYPCINNIVSLIFLSDCELVICIIGCPALCYCCNVINCCVWNKVFNLCNACLCIFSIDFKVNIIVHISAECDCGKNWVPYGCAPLDWYCGFDFILVCRNCFLICCRTCCTCICLYACCSIWGFFCNNTCIPSVSFCYCVTVKAVILWANSTGLCMCACVVIFNAVICPSTVYVTVCIAVFEGFLNTILWCALLTNWAVLIVYCLVHAVCLWLECEAVYTVSCNNPIVCDLADYCLFFSNFCFCICVWVNLLTAFAGPVFDVTFVCAGCRICICLVELCMCICINSECKISDFNLVFIEVLIT